MAHGLFVSAPRLFGQLLRPLVQLSGHLRRFLFRAAKTDEDCHEVVVHSAGTIRTDSTPIRLVGLLRSPPPPAVVGVSPMRASTSSPLTSSPKPVYWRSRNFASARQMKNWLPAESGSCDRAIEITPRTCERSLNSALT